MDKNNGGPAFPAHCTSDGHAANVDGGMSLRDYFAAKAMQGMLAHATRYRPRPGASSNWHEAMSEEAYEIADAMLRAKEST